MGKKMRSIIEILFVSTKLGLTSFGGPIAHLGYFHQEYIRRRQWLGDREYADLVALAQFLPGPASSQVGIGIGLMRGGLLGALFAWIGFTLPSALALSLFALLFQGMGMESLGWIHGLKIVAVAIVAQAVLSMGQKLITNRSKAVITLLAVTTTLLWQTAYSQIIVILLAGLIGFLLFKNKDHDRSVTGGRLPVSRTLGLCCLIFFFILLVVLPIIRQLTSTEWLAHFDLFYRAGSLVFGGGHVVLPLLEREIVTAGWMSGQEFIAGYGAAQAVPGPLFTFASYLGAIMNGWTGALVATIAIFLPAFLLIVGTLPFWDQLRRNRFAQGALQGINAAVVGILAAALYDPIWTSSIRSIYDVLLAVLLFVMLQLWKLPPWVIVVTGAICGQILIHLT